MWIMWNLVLVCLKIVLVSVQYRCTFCTERTIGSEIILTHSTILLGDVGRVESCFGPFEESVSVGARLVCGLRQTYHRLKNRFGRTRRYS
jgi:hypothetical protein